MGQMVTLGIDCGGTHTDAALLKVDGPEAHLLAAAKTLTRHESLPQCIAEVVEKVAAQPGAPALAEVGNVTLGTTLAINAILQGRATRVALALSSGPGLNPEHFVLGEHWCLVPGGLDHRGAEVTALYTENLRQQAALWPQEGVGAVAAVGKFSPRNPDHENTMAKVIRESCDLPVTIGHKLSGKLNFPRRIATAYYNAAVAKIQGQFLDAVEKALAEVGVHAPCRLLKADGGATPFSQSRREPVQSILSGPAASVMGALAAYPRVREGCWLLLDMGGTTTDIALCLNGSPVLDRDGMTILGRRTLVRSLATVSIPVGGDSLLTISQDDGGRTVSVGPMRVGPAAAFGGAKATLLDAFNVLGAVKGGNVQASEDALLLLARESGATNQEIAPLAQEALDVALAAITRAAYELVTRVNAGPVYTLAALKAAKDARPHGACVVGGPANMIREALGVALGMKVELAPHADVANAIGAALTRPTASLDVYADTAKGELWVPAMNVREKISPRMDLKQVESRAKALLADELIAQGLGDVPVEVIDADLFATLDDYGRGARDMRVTCQAVPGLMASLHP